MGGVVMPDSGGGGTDRLGGSKVSTRNDFLVLQY
jgi:hypothetical protein